MIRQKSIASCSSLLNMHHRDMEIIAPLLCPMSISTGLEVVYRRFGTEDCDDAGT